MSRTRGDSDVHGVGWFHCFTCGLFADIIHFSVGNT